MVSWELASADTHVVSGAISFSVGAPSSVRRRPRPRRPARPRPSWACSVCSRRPWRSAGCCCAATAVRRGGLAGRRDRGRALAAAVDRRPPAGLGHLARRGALVARPAPARGARGSRRGGLGRASRDARPGRGRPGRGGERADRGPRTHGRGPPTGVAAGSGPQELSGELGDGRIDAVVDQSADGRTTLEIQAVDEAGEPVTPVDVPVVRLRSDGLDLGPVVLGDRSRGLDGLDHGPGRRRVDAGGQRPAQRVREPGGQPALRRRGLNDRTSCEPVARRPARMTSPHFRTGLVPKRAARSRVPRMAPQRPIRVFQVATGNVGTEMVNASAAPSRTSSWSACTATRPTRSAVTRARSPASARSG